jgi:two-component system NtrC family sensor kinase
LVLKLRTFSRLDEGERQVASVTECVDSVLTILGHRLKDQISVVRRLDERDRLDCYPALLNQVLMNVLANAVDAIEAVGGRGTITVGTRVDGDRFEITVADDGCGIAPEIGDRVFEPFFTTKPVGQGTGLGLSIAYSIVKKHEGDLRLTDAEGGGTVAVIRLPLRPATS